MNKPFSLRELCRRALVVLVTIAMVSTSTPFAYAAEASSSEAQVNAEQTPANQAPAEQTPAEQATAEQAPADEKKNDANTAETNAVEPNATDADSGEATEPASSSVKEEKTTDEVEVVSGGTLDAQSEANVSLAFDHAYIHYQGQTVGAPTSSIAVTAGADFQFAVTADEGYEVSEVKATYDGQDHVLQKNADGLYVVTGEFVADGLQITVTAKGDPFAIKPNTTSIEEKRNEKSEFVYEDATVKVTATLTDPAALPEGVKFEVKPITKDAKDEDGNPAYNYDAYLEALNNNANGDKVYTENDVVLYDIGFFTQKKGEDGKPVSDDMIEVQLTEGQVKIDLQFKQQQLANVLKAENSSDIEIVHLPIKDSVRSTYDSTAEATGISANDVIVEKPELQKKSVEEENVEFSVNSLSAIGAIKAGDPLPFTASNDYSLANVLEGVLGDARYFGIVANTWHQSEAETNAAVKVIIPYQQTGNDLVDSDNHNDHDKAQPWYVGEVQNGTLNIKGEQAYVYADSEAQNHIAKTYEGMSPVFITTDKSVVNAYVENLISNVNTVSNDLVNRKSTTETSLTIRGDQDNCTLDLTSAGTGVVYIDMDNTYYQKSGTTNVTPLIDMIGNHEKVKLRIRSDQIVVFNTKRTNVTLAKLDGNKIFINDGGSDTEIPIGSVNGGKNNPPTHPDVAKQIIWNMPNATSVNMQSGTEMTGIFLAPNADFNLGGQTSGWLVANTFTNGNSEWHNVWQHYDRGWEDTQEGIVAHKKLDGSNQLGDKVFTFKLYEVINNNGNEELKFIEEKQNDAEGNIAFTPITYQVPEQYKLTDGGYNSSYTATYTYRIKEESGNVAGVVYDTRSFDVTVDVRIGADGQPVATVSYPNNQIPTFENTTGSQTVNLKINKTVNSQRPGQSTAEFPFELTLYTDEEHSQVDANNNTEYEIEKHVQDGQEAPPTKIKFNQGKATFNLRDGEYIEIKGLPSNTYYALTESPSLPYYTITFNEQEVQENKYLGTTPVSGTDEVSVVNTDGVGQIQIKKEIVAGLPGDSGKDFDVLVKLFDENNNAISNATYKDSQNQDIRFDEDGIARISLKSGETKTIKGLPLGYKYSVHEDANSSKGFEVTYSGAEGTTQDEGWISGNVTSQASLVTVTNARKGSLKVKKLIDGTDQEKQNAGKFHFTVELNQAITGKYGNMTFEEKTDNETTKYVANFDLSHNQSVTAEDLPIGVGYTVTETNPDGYIVKHNGITGATASGNLNSAELQTITFTNKVDKGSLSVKKTVDSIFTDDKDPSKTKYHFTVELDQAIMGEYGDMKFEKKTVGDEDKYIAEFDLGNNEVKKAEGLPAGVKYTVTEQAKTNFRLDGVTKNNNSVTVGNDQTVTGAVPHNDGTDELVYKNARDAGKLTLSKEVVSPIESERTKEFTFCVQLDDHSIAGEYKTNKNDKRVTFTGGYAEIEVKGNDSVTIEGLPAGIGYTVSEKTVTNFTLTEITKNNETVDLGQDQKATGTIPANSTDTVKLKNTRDTSGKFGFKKVVSSTNEADKNPQNMKFHFTVELDRAITGEYGDLKFEKKTVDDEDKYLASIDLGNNQAAKVVGMPVGVHYTITEADEDGFTATPTSVIEGDVTSVADEADISYEVITNTRSEGGLTVSKTVESPIADERDATKTKFHFTVELDRDITGEFGEMEFKEKSIDGKTRYVAEFDLGNNETCTAKGLPVGVGYTVTEDSNSNFNTSHHGTASEDYVDGNVVNADKQEKITKDGNVAVFKNRRSTGNLKLTKSVNSPITDELTNTEFTFVVELDNKTISGNFDTDNDGEKVLFSNGHAEVTVFGNKSITIEGLPADVSYTVTEKDTPNFKLTGMTVNSKSIELGEDPKATGRITKDKTDEVALENTRDTGMLTVEKTVDSTFDDDNDPQKTSFEFTVQLKDVAIEAGEYGDMSFDASGKATFSLGHNQTIKASGLPVGVGYTVTEMSQNGFTTTSHGTTSEDFTDGNRIENETITKDGTTATFKNTRDTGALKINKLVQVTGETGNVSMANGDYTFVITGPNEYSAERTIKVQNGVSDPVVIEGLMPGEYTVTEKTDSFVGNMVAKPEPSQTIEVVAGETAQAKAVNFTNELSTTTVSLEATKEFNNWDASVNEFKFKLEPSAVIAPAEKAPMPINALTGQEEESEFQTVTENERTAKFGTITFVKPGKFKYLITEVVDDANKDKGVTFDTNVHVVTVEVKAVNGKLSVDKVTYDKPFVLDANHTTLKIENKYDADGKIEIAGKKNLVGRSFKENDKWTFTLSQPNDQNAPMPKATENNPTPQVITIDASKDASIKFPEITYGLEDLWDEEQNAYKDYVDYTYYVTESNATENGVADVRLDAQPKKEVRVHVADNHDGTLAVTAEEDNDKNMFVFTNNYVAEMPLEVEKAIDGRDWLVNDQGESAEEYTFTITPTGDDNADIQAAKRKLDESNIPESATTHTVNKKHIAQFGTFKFTADDLPESGIAKYSYIVQEDRTGTTNNKKDGVTYSTVAYNVVYTVTMGEDNNLKVSAEYSYGEDEAKTITKDIRYLNTYKAEDDKVVFKAKKTLEGRKINNNEFGFELYLKTSSTPIDFNNANWKDIKSDFAWQQTKYTSGTNDYTQAITFDPIEFGKANVGKTATYVIREKLPIDDQGNEIKVKDGVTYDDTLHVVTVTTTDNMHGKYVAAVVYDDVALTTENENQIIPEFKNTYFGREAHISFDKQYFGTDPNAVFNFTMTGAKETYEPRDGAVVPYSDAFVDSGKALEVTLRKTATQNGTVAVDMPTITYHEPGKYYYTIKEVLSQDDKNTTYDTAVIQVEVDVTSEPTPKVTYKVVDGNQTINVNDNERATLYNNGNVAMSFRSAALRAMGQNAAFTNFEPAVSKILKNGVLKGNDFQFAIYEGDKAEGDALKVVGNDVNGKVSFGDDSGGFKYDESCVGITYKYTIVEVPGSDDAIVYDSDQVKLTVEVSKDANGAIIAMGSYEKGNSTDGFKATDEPTFINNYDNIVLRTIKRSREEPHDPLPGAHYGLWMVNPNGEDVYMGLGRNQLEEKGSILESNENGELYYDVPLLEGVAYYFLEEFPPPAGHLVDPYPTDYFTVVRDKDSGGYRIVHEGDPGFAEYCPDVKLRD